MSKPAVPPIKQQILTAVQTILGGGIVVFPTDTVFGLGCDPRNPKAVARVYEVKRRSTSLALPLLAYGIRQVARVGQLTPLGRVMARAFWPGALTLVLYRKGSFPSYVSGGGLTVALRVPRHPVPRAIARLLGVPIVGTSANLRGRPSALTAQEAESQLGGLVDFIVDGGTSPGGIESTVVDVTGPEPAVLREGAVPVQIVRDAWHQSRG